MGCGTSQAAASSPSSGGKASSPGAGGGESPGSGSAKSYRRKVTAAASAEGGGLGGNLSSASSPGSPQSINSPGTTLSYNKSRTQELQEGRNRSSHILQQAASMPGGATSSGGIGPSTQASSTTGGAGIAGGGAVPGPHSATTTRRGMTILTGLPSSSNLGPQHQPPPPPITPPNAGLPMLHQHQKQARVAAAEKQIHFVSPPASPQGGAFRRMNSNGSVGENGNVHVAASNGTSTFDEEQNDSSFARFQQYLEPLNEFSEEEDDGLSSPTYYNTYLNTHASATVGPPLTPSASNYPSLNRDAAATSLYGSAGRSGGSTKGELISPKHRIIRGDRGELLQQDSHVGGGSTTPSASAFQASMRPDASPSAAAMVYGSVSNLTPRAPIPPTPGSGDQQYDRAAINMPMSNLSRSPRTPATSSTNPNPQLGSGGEALGTSSAPAAASNLFCYKLSNTLAGTVRGGRHNAASTSSTTSGEINLNPNINTQRRARVRRPIPDAVPVKLGRLLGQGSHGAVYEGRREDTGQLIAVKITPVSDTEAMLAMKKEVRLLQKLNHANCINFLGSRVTSPNTNSDSPAMTSLGTRGSAATEIHTFLELVHGGTVSEMVATFGRVEDAQFLKSLTNQVLQGLQYLHMDRDQLVHKKGVVHRDLKGSNVLLTVAGEAVLTDMGTAFIANKGVAGGGAGGNPNHMLNATLNLFGENSYSNSGTTTAGGGGLTANPNANRLDQTLLDQTKALGQSATIMMQTMVGSLPWLAPEVLTAQQTGGYKKSADIWSLGGLLIEIASGKPPWAEKKFDNPIALMMVLSMGDLTPMLPEDNGGLGQTGKEFIRACLTRDAGKRPSASELLEDIWFADLDLRDVLVVSREEVGL